MRITSIDLPGFGPLSAFGCDLGPGLNVFHGENEAGKSTLQAAIGAMLYGFYDRDRAHPDETARHERFRPWAGGVYRGALRYELEDGREYEVRRDFSTSDVLTQVIDTTVGLDVSPQFGRGRHGNIPFARAHLGMSRGVFQSCAFISQGEIFELEKNASPSQIGDAIAALADSARRDVSAAKAIERLDSAAQKIGSDRARTAELPKAREAHRRATDELQRADELRANVAQKSRRLDDLQKRVRHLAETALRTEYLWNAAEAGRLRSQLWKLDECEAALAEAEQRIEELRSYSILPATLRDEAMILRSRHERAEEVLRSLRDRQAGVTLTDDARFEYERLRESVGALTDDQVRSLTEAAYQVPQAAPTGLWAALAAIAGAIGRAVVSAVRFVLRRPAPAQVQIESALDVSQEEALALLDKHHRYLTLRPQIEESNRLAREIEAEEGALERSETQLRTLLADAGIESESLARAFEQLEAAWQKREEYARAAADAEEGKRARALLLDGRSRKEIAAAAAECEERRDELAREHPRLSGLEADRPSGQLARELEKARAEKHETELDAQGLAKDVALALDGCRPRAEIEEELAHWERQVERLEKGRAALALARDAIQEAMTNVYRDFAPAVNTFLSEGMEAATDGRYRRAHVDPATLQVSLLVPETDQVVTNPPVSHGTRTLLYVLMRIGLAQHMSAIGEPVPLVLDDPFVDVDSRRLERILDFLLELSERMQILLFTKDREIVRWFDARATGEGHRLHQLDTLLSPSRL